MSDTLHFKNIGLCLYYATPSIIATLKHVYEHLKTLDVTLVLEENTARHLPKHPYAEKSIDSLCRSMDCLIVVGGDGSMLSGAIDAAKCQVPLIGINRGKLGFLSDINPDRLKDLTDMLCGKFKEEKRPLLMLSSNQQSETYLALNDVVLARRQSLHLLEYDVFVDQAFVCHQRADGLIISTPTGSTAYALSAGGPIISPKLNAIGLTPLCPHTLTSRPLMLPDSCQIDIHILPNSQSHAQVHHDGHSIKTEEPLAHIRIQKSEQAVTLMHPLSYNYYDTLKHKLHWEQKPYAAHT